MLHELRDWAEELACRAGLDGLGTAGRRASFAVLVVVACVAGAAWFSNSTVTVARPQANGAPAPTVASTAREASGALPALLSTVTVHVVGEVRRPGVYQLAGGARAADAVAAAGGLLGDAEQGAVNLARVVADGEQISVPRQGAGPVAASASTPGGGQGAAAAGGKIDLNTANEAQLDTLPGIGPATAQKIIADRTANGPFRTVDDLLRVPGIGPSKVESLKDLVSAG